MASTLRSPRVLQRLASRASRTGTTRILTGASQRPTSAPVLVSCICVRCHLRASSTITVSIPTTPSLRQRHRQHQHQNRSFATTSRRQASKPASETASIPNRPDTTTHYTIFPQTLPNGPPPASPFTIDLPTLRREFLQLQNTLHPDKYPPGPMKQEAEALSARINEAYRTLADPLLRGQYLLKEMHGIDVTAEDGAGQHPMDPELLTEVMDVQEAIEEVGDGPEAEKAIEEMKTENEARVRGCVEALAGAFDGGDVEAARGECVRLKFWVSVGEGLREWEPGMGGIRLVH
ncbi:J-type chaperone JAC1 [Aspergillus lucknowensis]|uniref:J domain-containing protein n=1 Tax=Aspergillus lucknowensis TaxID=176173 RepID=A0ABR4LZK1_9EURO